ncbi:enoyl-CoA hydratase [Candidatus Acetothermia bacterium]|nr:enoyl-CoA hydratase [Candidatus Acetothermia bacterium]
MNFQTVQYSVKESVATVTMSRPEKYNACNGQMLRELQAAIHEARKDKSVRAVILTGAGKAFCSGADLADLGDDFDLRNPFDIRRWMNDLFHPIILGIQEMEKPWIASVNGPAVGAGCQLALACDLVLIAEEAYLCEIFNKRGLVVDLGGTYFLPRIIGPHKAKELAFFGDKISGQQCVELGLANRSAPLNQLNSITAEWSQKLAQGATRALGLTKLGINRGIQKSLEETLIYEAQAQGLVANTEDVLEGVRAFLEKREPRFTGK